MHGRTLGAYLPCKPDPKPVMRSRVTSCSRAAACHEAFETIGISNAPQGPPVPVAVTLPEFRANSVPARGRIPEQFRSPHLRAA